DAGLRSDGSPFVATERLDRRPECDVASDRQRIADLLGQAESQDVPQEAAAHASTQELSIRVVLCAAGPADVGNAVGSLVLPHDRVRLCSRRRQREVLALKAAQERVDAPVERKGPAVGFDELYLCGGGPAPEKAAGKAQAETRAA